MERSPWPLPRLAPSLLPERKALFTVDALCTLVIDHQAFPLQHDVQPGTAEALPLPCQLTHSPAQDVIVALLRLVPVDRGRDAGKQTGPSLTQPKAFCGICRCQLLHLGLQKFFASNSLRDQLSNACWATICLRRRFSSSRDLSLFNSFSVSC